ncbi:hypothetical protein EmuJ_000033300 [Echinococcus multilocularis]|uniref:Uncharacterized protein n=1 Tax=Echinococcus multilocularis TaxID=6211 RepID=A0A087VWS7_ECHMU|nr:hypothetical protein EmuJ_000033300 [Echinococcus multilocularis]
MMTRNRGKSKSVVEKLGLVRKNKRRGSKDADSAEASTVLSTALHERSGREPEKEMSGVWSEAGELAVTDDVNAGSQSDREANGFDSAKTTPARWSSYPDELDVFAIGQPAFINCENELRALRYDWFPPNNFHCFQVCDEILREVMEEISTVGGVYLSRRQFLQSRLRKNGPKENEREDVVHAFREINLQNLFDQMSADMVKMNDDLDEKDILLASCGLVRPGVTRALRRRRLMKCKQPKRGAMRRLRLNPRPRRFSDMVNPSVEAAERLTGLSRNAKRVRDRNARAAAKKLAQAKSQASHMLRSTTEVRRGRPRKSSQPLSESNKRSVSRSAMQTRPRRSMNIRHHIDWKFCYGDASERTRLQEGGEVAIIRKRCAPTSSHTSADENEEEEEEEEEAEAKEQRRGLEQTRGAGGEAQHGTGIVRCEGAGAEADISLVKSVAGVATQEVSVLRGSDLRRCARSMLFERKRRRNVLRLACAQSRSRSGSLSESSNDFDGGARCYLRKVAVVRPSHEVGFLAGQRKRRGCFYARPSRAFAASRNAVASTTVGDAEVHIERARALHRRRDLHRRLTLLDRVVLGLTCSVVQDGDEIHIKQLHSDDLSILLQRVTETGFNINGLSTKTNANSEQEFNITLAYHPRGETLVRQVRKRNTSGAQSSPSTTTTMLASNAFRGAQVLSPTSVAAATVGGSAGATGGTVCSDTHSDGEGGLKGRELVVCDSPPSLRPSSAMGHNRSRVLSVAARRRGVQLGGGRMLHPLHRMGMRHLSAAAAAAAAAAVARSSGSVARRPRSRDSDAAEEGGDDAEGVPHAHAHTLGHQSHHPASPFVLPLAGGLSFRRHSPRKVIRKVYTGTSTVPKILNRRRLLIAGGTHLSSQQASQPSVPPFALSQTTTTVAPVGVTMSSMSTGGSGAGEVVMARENQSSQAFSRVYSSVAIEAATAEALVESSEKVRALEFALFETI